MTPINLTAPQNWSELTSGQLETIAPLYEKELTREAFLTAAFMKTAKIRILQKKEGEKYRFRHRRKKFTMSAELFAQMSETLAFLLETPEKCQPPKFKGFISPDIGKLTLDEYLTADFHYLTAIRERGENRPFDKNGIARLAAALWRRKGEKFTESRIERRRWHFTRKTTAIYIWWTGLKASLRNDFPAIFGSGGGGEETDYGKTVLELLSVFNGGRPQENERILKVTIREIFFELEKFAEKQQKSSKSI